MPMFDEQYCHVEARMTAHTVAERLGGERVLRRVVENDFDMIEAIEGGLPIAAVEAVIRDGTFSAAELHELVLPRRTFTHRKQKGQCLTADEFDQSLPDDWEI